MQEFIFITSDSSRVPNSSCLPLSFMSHGVVLNRAVPLFFFLQILVLTANLQVEGLDYFSEYRHTSEILCV